MTYVRGTPLQLVEAIRQKNMRRLKDANLEQLLGRLALLQRWAQSELDQRKSERKALPLPMMKVQA